MVVVVLVLADGVAVAATPALSPETARQRVEARGVGKMVKVHEVDGTVLRGKIVSAGENSFGLQVRTQPAVEVPFARVSQVGGPGLSRGQKIAIVVGVAAVAVVAIVLVYKTEHIFSGPTPTFPVGISARP